MCRVQLPGPGGESWECEGHTRGRMRAERRHRAALQRGPGRGLHLWALCWGESREGGVVAAGLGVPRAWLRAGRGLVASSRLMAGISLFICVPPPHARANIRL